MVQEFVFLLPNCTFIGLGLFVLCLWIWRWQVFLFFCLFFNLLFHQPKFPPGKTCPGRVYWVAAKPNMDVELWRTCPLGSISKGCWISLTIEMRSCLPSVPASSLLIFLKMSTLKTFQAMCPGKSNQSGLLPALLHPWFGATTPRQKAKPQTLQWHPFQAQPKSILCHILMVLILWRLESGSAVLTLPMPGELQVV